MGDADLDPNVPGAITSGIDPNTLITRTIAFVKEQLPAWRDHPDRAREEAERRLNSQLCKFLNSQARHFFPMANFHHEEPQGRRWSVDLSASPAELICADLYGRSLFEPFLVFEAKRLPAPSARREREYVTGYEDRSGGIQRFKLRLHAINHETAAMIGYVQKGQLAAWLPAINGWISELVGVLSRDGCTWLESEQLTDYQEDARNGTASCFSRHPRCGHTPADPIDLYHLWVLMFGS